MDKTRESQPLKPAQRLVLTVAVVLVYAAIALAGAKFTGADVFDVVAVMALVLAVREKVARFHG